jgi:hypothetical protein
MELVDTTLSSIFANKYASSMITLFLVIYGGLAAPKLPKFMIKLFENPIFRIAILSLIVYNGNRDPKFAIMIAVAFTVTLNMISNQKFLEGFDTHEDFTDTDDDDDDDEPTLRSSELESMSNTDECPIEGQVRNSEGVCECPPGTMINDAGNACEEPVV